tara:strand:- start:3303 stop:4889 length:1587 start_codon:yes stop_codon:yes gene_type:complete
MSASASPVKEGASAPRTSPINAPPLRRMSLNGAVRSESARAGGESKSRDPPGEGRVYYWRNGQWHTGDRSAGITVRVQNPKNNAVLGALLKMQKGVEANRDTTLYLMEGIRKWCDEQKRSVDPDTEETFVKYVWHHMRQKQRDNATSIEARRLQQGLDGAKEELVAHYAEFPGERKSDDELVSMFHKLGAWYSVTSSEQRRIASKKRHDKEERLVETQFCGDRVAYNRFKALNEKVSLGRIRDVSPQLLVKFANWLEENPDFLYPGSKDTSILNAEHHVRDPLSYQYDTLRGFHNISLINADVSKEHMLTTIKELMSSFTSARIEVTLEFDRSPHEYTMTDKYPLLKMHGCQRLISGEKHVILAVNNDKLVFEKATIMIKRLPDEFHQQLKGHCEREGLFKELECHKVFAYAPGLITKATISGQTMSGPSDRENFKIELRLTSRANKTFSLEDILHKKRLDFVESLKKEATSKLDRAVSQRSERRHAATRATLPPKDIVEQLMNLKVMRDAGDLTQEQFDTAKNTLFH